MLVAGGRKAGGLQMGHVAATLKTTSCDCDKRRFHSTVSPLTACCLSPPLFFSCFPTTNPPREEKHLH